MITRLEIENFKAIKHLAIDLDPLTVLVGPNDSGKSTILQALDLLSRSRHRAISGSGGRTPVVQDQQEIIHKGDRGKKVLFAVSGLTVAGEPYRYELAFGFSGGRFGVLHEKLDGEFPFAHQFGGLPSGRSQTRIAELNEYPDTSAQVASLSGELTAFLVAFEPKQLARPCAPDTTLHASGFGLAALIDRVLTDTDRTRRDAYEDALRTFSPHVLSLGTRVLTADASHKEVVFGLKDKTRIPAREASSGLLAVAGYLGLLHVPTARFLIEEPENGLHPQAMLQVVDVLRKLANDGRQVVMTTHSPILLNYMDPGNIRIVTRTAAEGVRVTPALESKAFNELRQKVDFGELWYSIGDEALAAGA